jgi:hypothetical protein
MRPYDSHTELLNIVPKLAVRTKLLGELWDFRKKERWGTETNEDSYAVRLLGPTREADSLSTSGNAPDASTFRSTSADVSPTKDLAFVDMTIIDAV